MMAKFMLLQRGGCGNSNDMSPEQMQQQMQGLMEWMQKGSAEGWILDPGSPLGAGAVVQSDQSVIDGAFADSKDLIGGYMTIEAADLAAAIETVKSSPMIRLGSTIEVRELPSMEPPG